MNFMGVCAADQTNTTLAALVSGSRLLTTQSSNSIVLTADGMIKTGAGVLKSLTFSPDTTKVIVYDNTSAAGTKIFDSGTIDLTDTAASVPYTWYGNAAFGTGAYCDLTGSTFIVATYE